MTIQIKPRTLAAGSNNPNRQVSVNVWNDGHELTATADRLIGTDGSGVGTEVNKLDLPISTAAQTALNAKAALAGGNTFTGAQSVSGSGASPAWSINQGNQGNVPVISVTNIGAGTAGLRFAKGSGTFNAFGNTAIGSSGGTPWSFDSTHRGFAFRVDNNADDAAAQAFYIGNATTLTRHVLSLRHETASATGDYLRATDSAGTVKARIASDGKMWLLGVSSPVFDEAANVLGRGLAFDSGGATVAIPANNQWNFIGIRNAGSNINFTINSGAIVSGLAYYMTADSGSHSTSNLYGVVGDVSNAGPGTAKALYGRAIASATCTGTVMGGVFRAQIDTGANPSGAYAIQLGHAGDPLKALNGVVLIDTEAASGKAAFGILSANSMSYTTAFIRACAGGGGKFLQFQASGGGADLFNVLDSGAIFTNVSLTVGTGATVITDGQITRSVAGGNMIVTSGGAGTLFLGYGATYPLQISSAGNINITSNLHYNSSQILTSRRTGWAAATGTATRTTFDTSTVTLPQLAERVKAVLDDLATHGLIGA